MFSELPVSLPEVRLESSSYVVRLPDQTEIPLAANEPDFEAALLETFPECGSQAIEFYRECALLSDRLRNAGTQEARGLGGGLLKRIKAFRSDSWRGNLLDATRQTVSQRLADTSFRFRRLYRRPVAILTQTSSDSCNYPRGCRAHIRARDISIQGGAATVARETGRVDQTEWRPDSL